MGAAGHVRRVEAGLQSVRDSKAEAGSNAVGGNNSIAEKRGKMTEQRRRQICTELARRMGWHIAFLGDDPSNEMALHRPNGCPVASTVGRMSEDVWQYAPDPSTNAADKDALVKWLATDDDRWRSFFKHFSEALELDFDVEYPVYCAMLMMTASPETITLAACKALGIGETGEAATDTHTLPPS